MPIREYECRKCGLRFETIDLGGEKGEITCPRCHSDDVEKKISLFSSSASGSESCGFRRGFG
jgi:putative FmdB family regulatory protein